jgi:hypothetical protein
VCGDARPQPSLLSPEEETAAHVFFFSGARLANPTANIFKMLGTLKSSPGGEKTGEGKRHKTFLPD